MLNETQVTFSGWIGTDVTVRDVAGGQQVATFRVATTPRRRREGEWVDGPTTWHTVKAWNRLARHVAESLVSGQPVLVHGKLVADTWTRDDGTAVTSYAVVASSVGHDLVHGTSVFRRPEVATATPSDEAVATAVVTAVEASVEVGVTEPLAEVDRRSGAAEAPQAA